MPSKNEDALALADETLRLVETGAPRLVPIVLRCLRLARLMGHDQAERWFQCELRGYGANGAGFDKWEQYAIWSGRHGSQGTDGQRNYYISPIEQIETELELALIEYKSNVQESLNSLPFADQLTARRHRNEQFQKVQQWTRIVSTLRGSIQDWLSNSVMTLRYGALVESVVQRTRARFDRFLEAQAPEAGHALAAAFRRADSQEPEEWSQALTSCRRALKALADRLYPPTDAQPAGHPLGEAEYKNRLIQFASERLSSESQLELLEAEIDSVARRADALNNLSSKGVHGQVEVNDLELTVIHTYLLAGELLELVPEEEETATEPITTEQQASEVSGGVDGPDERVQKG